jgi:hypothetical protein
MKKLLVIISLLFSIPVLSQDSIYVVIDPQGNGTTAWQVSEFRAGQLIDKYNTSENPNAPKWKELKMALFGSPLFQRAIVQANPNAYSTLLKVLSDGENGDGNEGNLHMMINMLGMTFSQAEKAELNGYFEINNFTIRL